MTPILLFISNPSFSSLWKQSLSATYQVSLIKEIPEQDAKGIVVIDTEYLEKHPFLLTKFSQLQARYLIVGHQWSEDKQVHALINGAAGYCDLDISTHVIQQAISSLEKGDIWLQRHLIQRVIGSLVQLNSQKASYASEEQLKKLSARELEVAQKVATGENNKKIAQALNITERTVKAHLTAIFRKLEIHDRLHLALFLKENHY